MSDESHTGRLEAALAGRYKIERKLGEGGMASVYLAEDLKHERNVALKILRPELAAVIGAERFLSEIKTTANLQHPHILPLFDSGEAEGYLYYVMPYIDGETLREKLDREKQLGVDESVRIAKDMADALDYAHRAGVIHRDIKPGNVLLHDGRPVVADFGIALAVSAAGGGRMTETGLSLGTPHYMSPEQASADRDLSARSDVYSLGCVLYEMIAGQPPHTGPSAQSILVHILTEDPKPLSRLRHTVPPHIASAVAKSIEKLPADRFESAKHFVEALEDEAFTYQTRPRAPGDAAPPAVVPVPAERPSTWRLALPWATAGVFAIAAATAWLVPDPPSLVQRYLLALDDLGYGGGPSLAISPDGSTIAYMGADLQLYWRNISSLEAQVVPGSANSRAPFFSPDGRTIGYSNGPPNDDRLRTFSLDGAPARTLAGDHFPGAAWGDDGYVYYVDVDGALFRVSEQGGEPEMLSEGEERLFRFPQPLPGGRTVLVAVSGDGAPVIAAFDVESREVRPLREGSFARYANGHVFWLGAAGTLFVSPFDARAVDLTSAGVEVADGVQPSLQGSYDFAVAENGTVVYSVGTGGASGVETLVWLERSGGTTVVDPALLAQFSDIDNLALSPDGRYIALEVASVDEPIEGGPAQIWIYDLQEAFATRLTFQGTRNAQPRWLPDGRTVAYLSDQGDGPLAIWAQPFDRTGSDALLFQAEWPIEGFDVSPVEGAPLLITDGRTPPDGFYLAPPGTATVEPFLVTEFVETYPRISPDGRWVVYQANESGRNEVYVRSFPEGGRPWPISREGGSVPIWSPSGTEIIYGSPGQLYLIAASVELGDEVRVSAQTEMLQGSPLAAMEFGAPERASVSYDVSLDGQRLLVPMGSGAPMAGSTVGEAGVVLILNIFEELRQRSRG